MQMQNIGGHENDPFFRYRMPTIVTKVEGSGKMIKTFISNLDLLAVSLKRTPDAILKYLGYACNVATNTGRGYISGNQPVSVLSRHLKSYVETFVLCANCLLPEASLIVSKKGLSLRCGSCGHSAPVNVNANDSAGYKLQEFLVKNPPASSKSSKSDKKRDRQERQSRAERTSSKKDATAPDDDQSASCTQPELSSTPSTSVSTCTTPLTTPTTTATTVCPTTVSASTVLTTPTSATSTTTSAVSSPPAASDDVTMGGLLATATASGKMAASELMEATLQEAADEADAAAVVDDDGGEQEETIDSVAAQFASFIASHENVEDITAQLRTLQIVHGYDAETRLAVLIKALLNANALSQLQTPRVLQTLQQFFKTAASQLTLLHCLASLTGTFPQLLQNVPSLLNALYNNDLLEEEVVVEWYEKNPASKLCSSAVVDAFHKAAKPFVEWLNKAEEEDDEDEDDD
eukprot:gnl/Spiro4/8492_TR4459_c0_g1_i1.p1 gnl/Spiro4/8492_TR4459_c0_g1~~gnl/Spiro4/8492_TR4459_c0_g1_i1.p1  ORF type:complete len:462 (-),score=99.77 gnl/Spiro4/8492_TR4459_c0_g1_i1:102-1487(-)